MKVLLVSAVFAVAAGVPSNRNGCPSLGQIQAEFESALGLQVLKSIFLTTFSHSRNT